MDRISPLPDPWAQTGILAREVHNGWAARPKTAADFMPVRRDSGELQDVDEQMRIASRFFPEAFADN